MAVPKRVAFIQKNVSAHVLFKPERMVMTFPDLIIRGLIGLEILILVLAVVSLLVDAPLEGIANPVKTPNPAKAPWYFLGLQELLHYFPPVVAGVLIPTLVVIALIIIPYFDINIKRERLWHRRTPMALGNFVAVFIGLMIFLLYFKVYDGAIPTAFLGLLMIGTYLFQRETGFWGWLCRKSLADWLMSWFITVTVVLTVVGTFFRGPGWSWVWPWK
jgi:quinol-cytochrome oxidoreductase complex cytochrome b subunit